MTINVSILKPVTSRNKSYYGKAKVIEAGGVKYLKSYDTVVCVVTADGEFIRLWEKYSPTTLNHVNDFRALFGFECLNKKAWDKLEVGAVNIPREVVKTPMKYKAAYYSNDIYNPYI